MAFDVIFLSYVFIGPEWNEAQRSTFYCCFLFIPSCLFVSSDENQARMSVQENKNTRLVCLNCLVFFQMKKFSRSHCMTQFYVSTYRDFSCIIHQSKRNVNQRWKVNSKMLKLKCKMCTIQPLMLFATYPSSNILVHSLFLFC